MPASSRPWISGGPLCEAPLGQAHAAPFALTVAVPEGCPYACESKAPDTRPVLPNHQSVLVPVSFGHPRADENGRAHQKSVWLVFPSEESLLVAS